MTDGHRLVDNYARPDNVQARMSIHDRFGVNPQRWHAWVAEQLSLEPGMTVLEIGCGTGVLWQHVAPWPTGMRLVLTDRSDGMLNAVCDTSDRLGHAGIEVRRLDINDDDPGIADVDLVIANHMLYHVDDPDAVVRKLRGCLKPGGRAVFAANGFAHMEQLMRLVRARAPDAPDTDLAQRFGLETGYGLVRDVFGNAAVLRYADALHVTDSDALMAYVRSLPWPVPDAALESIAQTILEHVAANGAFFVTKDAGVVTARR